MSPENTLAITQMKATRYIVASLIAPIAALLVPGLFALSEFQGEAVPLSNGSFDDGAIRAAGLLLVIGLTILYIVAVCFYAAVAHALVRLKRFSLRALLSVCGAAPWLPIAVATGGLLANNRSIFAGLEVLGIVGVLISLFAILGGTCWLFIAVPKREGSIVVQPQCSA